MYIVRQNFLGRRRGEVFGWNGVVAWIGGRTKADR